MAGLTLKQQKFSDEYIITGNVEQSAVSAGYSRSYARGNAHKLLANVSIKAYIAERLAEIKTEKVADQQEVLEALTCILRGQKRGTALVGKGNGLQEVTDVTPTVAEKIRAAELLGKRYSMWTDKQEISGTVGVVQIIDDIPGGPDD